MQIVAQLKTSVLISDDVFVIKLGPFGSCKDFGMEGLIWQEEEKEKKGGGRERGGQVADEDLAPFYHTHACKTYGFVTCTS